MPKRSVAAVLVTKVIAYLKVLYMQKMGKAVKCIEVRNCDGPTASSMLCSKHFEQDCCLMEGVCYREDMGFQQRGSLSLMPALHDLLGLPCMVRVAGPHLRAKKRRMNSASDKQ